MRRVWVGVLILAGVAVIVGVLHHRFGRLGRLGMTEGSLAHAHNEFTFRVQAPMAEAFPLFGAEGERAWGGPHWDPEFVYPVPAKDVEGAVFRVHHGHHSATWVNTAFDAEAGHAAYVYVIDGKLATRIDVQLSAIDPGTTQVRVMYERTALSPSVNPDVMEMAQKDAKMGPEWERDIAAYLKKRGGK
ncbi:MAG: hypothetical protein JOY95_15440 [Silvibacterium sp.]|nr:hypothetical protein [Silvibacterium sp.]